MEKMETTMQGTTTFDYRLTTRVELQSENNIADYYFLKYEVKILDEWTFYDGIGAFDFNNNLEEVTISLAEQAKNKWGVVYG